MSVRLSGSDVQMRCAVQQGLECPDRPLPNHRRRGGTARPGRWASHDRVSLYRLIACPCTGYRRYKDTRSCVRGTERRSFAPGCVGYTVGMTDSDAILVGGPRDGTPVAADGAGLLEIEIDGMVHRYIPTKQHRDDKAVYTYDGVVDPRGAADGAENAKNRQASPLADREDGIA
jgi:hypothetical protein